MDNISRIAASYNINRSMGLHMDVLNEEGKCDIINVARAIDKIGDILDPHEFELLYNLLDHYPKPHIVLHSMIEEKAKIIKETLK